MRLADECMKLKNENVIIMRGFFLCCMWRQMLFAAC